MDSQRFTTIFSQYFSAISMLLRSEQEQGQYQDTEQNQFQQSSEQVCVFTRPGQQSRFSQYLSQPETKSLQAVKTEILVDRKKWYNECFEERILTKCCEASDREAEFEYFDESSQGEEIENFFGEEVFHTKFHDGFPVPGKCECV